jgi:hypothetical protein
MQAWFLALLFLCGISSVAATCTSTNKAPIDICFTVDQSGSIDDSEYAQMVNFIGDIVNAASDNGAFPMPGEGSVVAFATNATLVLPLTGNATAVMDAVNPRIYTGRTALSSAIDLCLTQLIQSTNNLPKVQVILTDGVNNENSTRTPAEIQARASAAGIFVIALAIGDETDPTALRNYLPVTSPAGVLYYATDFMTGLQNLVKEVIMEVNDADEDGVCNDVDKCPGFDDNIDTDGDGIPDGCDKCPTDPEIQYSEDEAYIKCGCNGDTDHDGVCNADDICPGFDDHIDTDGDGVPDGCDVCPLDPEVGKSSKNNEDYSKCGCEGDTDHDGVCNDVDKCPGFDDKIDSDEDGIPDGCDNCASVYNPEQRDGNKNGLGDACEIDMCEYAHKDIDVNASCVFNCGGGRWSNCAQVCALFGIPFVSNVQCNNAGIVLNEAKPHPYNDRCDRKKVCCMCRPFVNNYPTMKAHVRGSVHRGHYLHNEGHGSSSHGHYGHHVDDCDCEDLLEE